MPIDLGNDPTGTSPSPSEKLQIRTALGVGVSDAVTFDSLSASTSLTLPSTTGSAAGHVYSSTDTIRYRDTTNTERLLLNSADNLGNLTSLSVARTNLGLGTGDGVAFRTLSALSGLTIGTGNAKLEYTPGSYLILRRSLDGTAIITLNPEANSLTVGTVATGSVANIAQTTVLNLNTANAVEQRNGTNKQTFRVYNTNLSGAPEWAEFDWITSGGTNTLRIGTNLSGTGVARPIDFVTGGVTRMSILSTGSVGIGTATPGSGLQISGAMGTNTITYDSPAALKLTNTNGVSWLLTSGVIGVVNASFCIRQESTALPALTIAGPTNNIGIGTTSPVTKLDIAETWNSPTISLTGASGNGTTAVLTFATQAASIPIGSTIVVQGINPSGYNGTVVVTAATQTSISYLNATTASYVAGGTVERIFTTVKANITDTASSAASNLMDLQVGGTTKVNIDKSGLLIFPPAGGNGSGAVFGGTSNGSAAAYVGQYGFRLAGNLTLQWSAQKDLNAPEIGIGRNSAGVLEVNSGTLSAYRDIRVRSVIQRPLSSITPALSGDLVVEATSDTQLTFKYKGSDGIVRSSTITMVAI